MKIKLHTQLSGPAGSHAPGRELETGVHIDSDTAKRLVAAGFASEVTAPKKGRRAEQAVARPGETSAEDDARAMREHIDAARIGAALQARDADVETLTIEIGVLQGRRAAADAAAQSALQAQLDAKQAELKALIGDAA